MYQPGDVFEVTGSLPGTRIGHTYTICSSYRQGKKMTQFYTYVDDNRQFQDVTSNELYNAARLMTPSNIPMQLQHKSYYVSYKPWGPKCECGAEAAKQPGHSQWCPRFGW